MTIFGDFVVLVFNFDCPVTETKYFLLHRLGLSFNPFDLVTLQLIDKSGFLAIMCHYYILKTTGDLENQLDGNQF